LERRKIGGIICIIVAVIVLVINLAVIYPFINCAFAPYVFWLIFLLLIIGGVVLMYYEQIKAKIEEFNAKQSAE
jgi:undecaprenyl pyrophosphate phosphatase UppP